MQIYCFDFFLIGRSFILVVYFVCKLLIVPLENFLNLESFWWHIYSAVIIKREGPYWITQQGAHINRCAQYNEYGIIKSNQTTLKRQHICLRYLFISILPKDASWTICNGFLGTQSALVLNYCFKNGLLLWKVYLSSEYSSGCIKYCFRRALVKAQAIDMLISNVTINRKVNKNRNFQNTI